MSSIRFFAILGFIFFGILSRFLPHPPNFTAMNAIALFCVFSLNSLSLSLWTLFATMFLSDFLIGFHSSIPFVYLSFGLIVSMGQWLNSRRALPLSFCLTISSLLFFIITNFGVWLMDPLYPKTYTGLGLCYLAALPFLANQILGDLIYGAVLFGCFSFAERLMPGIRLLEPKSISYPSRLN